MALATNRLQFKERLMRELGYPVIKINVSEEQVEDRIDDALERFYRFHFDGSERHYFVRVLSADDAATGTITMDPDVIGVARVMPLQGTQTTGSLLFNVPYQIMMSEIFGQNGSGGVADGIGNYVMARHQLNLLQEFLIGQVLFRYNEKTNTLYLDVTSSKLVEGGMVCVECFRKTTAYDGNPGTFPDVWSDDWLRKYAVALVRLQWGDNMSKFGNVQLPGGVTMNGPETVQRAKSDLRDLEVELRENWVAISHDLTG